MVISSSSQKHLINQNGRRLPRDIEGNCLSAHEIPPAKAGSAGSPNAHSEHTGLADKSDTPRHASSPGQQGWEHRCRGLGVPYPTLADTALDFLCHIAGADKLGKAEGVQSSQNFT